MARATIPKTKTSGVRSANKPGRPASKATVGTQATAKSAKSSMAVRGSAAKQAVTASGNSKEELRARIEKLERANSTLRQKNKELRFAYVEAAERVDQLTVRLESVESRHGRQSVSAASSEGEAARGRAAATRRRGARSEPDEDQVREFSSRVAEPMAV